MYEILEAIMREFNVKPYDISKGTGISSSVFTDWKKGRYTPKVDKLEKIADYFGLPISVFFSDISELPKYLRERKPRQIFECAAGQGRINGDYATDEYKEEEVKDTEEYMWCRICGESMSPELLDGDLVKVHLQTETTPQDLTVIKVNGDEVTVKYVEIVKDGVWLRAINKEVYEDHFFSVSEVMTLPIRIIGKVVMVQRNYE